MIDLENKLLENLISNNFPYIYIYELSDSSFTKSMYWIYSNICFFMKTLFQSLEKIL